MKKLSPKTQKQIRRLLESSTRLFGLHVCYHDLLHLTGLPLEWQQHENPACLSVKAKHQPVCAKFCGEKIEREITGAPEGSVHTCPFGHTDIAVPVWHSGLLAGVLYANACWTGKGKPPREGLVLNPSQQWLEDRRILLCATARQLEKLFTENETDSTLGRRETIAVFIDRNLNRQIRLEDLAQHLSLSPSRTGHLVKEIFGETYPALLTRLRLLRAARQLCTGEKPVGEIALLTGFSDQSHFTHAFKKRFKMTPLLYRKKYRTEV